MKKFFVVVLLVSAIIIAGCFIYLKNESNHFELQARMEYYLYLTPADLWGTEMYGIPLAKARLESNEWIATQFTDPYQAVEYGFDLPGEYRWVNWTWENDVYKNIYEDIYGSGIWIRKGVDRNGLTRWVQAYN